MKIYINRNPVEGPWGGGNNFVKAMYKELPLLGYEIINDPYVKTPDVIFLQSPKPDHISRFSINDAIQIKKKYKQTKLILRVNDCDARKGTNEVDDMWVQCSRYVDKTIFVSNWIKEYFLKKEWSCKENHVVYNGVNLKHFKERDKIKNGKINIVTHHWSNNRMKGFDIYEEIDKLVGVDDRLTFTYIGRDLGTFKNTQVIQPIFGEALGVELSKYDIYVSDSKYDPGPNHILESLACKIPTYVCKNGGGSVEFVGKENTFTSIKDFIEKIMGNKYYKSGIIDVHEWSKCIEKIKEVIE